MAFIRGFIAIIISTLILWIIGGLYEYIKPGFVPNPEEFKYVWPWFFAFGGAVGGLISVVLYALWSPSKDSGPIKETPRIHKVVQPKPKVQEKLEPKKAEQPIKQTTVDASKASDEVPGMPTFDFDSIKSDAEKFKDLEG